ncbi:MAG: hypothetical protein IJU64_06285 [Bacilli bacterium]|nr:hypothetical protein [Bacilli bacterium]
MNSKNKAIIIALSAAAGVVAVSGSVFAAGELLVKDNASQFGVQIQAGSLQDHCVSLGRVVNEEMVWDEIALSKLNNETYELANISLKKDDIFKIRLESDDWRGYDTVKSCAFATDFFEEDDSGYSNIKVKADVVTHIYINVTPEDGKSIWFQEQDRDYSKYAATLGGSPITLVDDHEGDKGGDDWVYQFKVPAMHATADQVLAFTYNGNAIHPQASGETNNIARNDSTQALTIKNEATEDLYFKVYMRDGYYTYDTWYGGYVAPITEHYMYLERGGDSTQVVMTKDPEKDELQLLGYEFKAGDKFKLVYDSGDWRGFDKVKATNFVNAYFEDDDSGNNNFLVKADVKVDIYFAKYAETEGTYVGKSIWIEASALDTSLFSATLAGNPIELEDVTASKGPGDAWVYQLHADIEHVAEGQALAFMYNNQAIAVAPSGGENNVVDNNGLKVVNDADNVNLWFKVNQANKGEDYSYDIWLDGYVSPTPTTKTINCNFSSVDSGGSAVLYVWAWKDGSEGSWYEVTGAWANAQVVVPTEVTDLILVRMNPSGAPSWDAKWDQSNSLTYQADKTLTGTGGGYSGDLAISWN